MSCARDIESKYLIGSAASCWLVPAYSRLLLFLHSDGQMFQARAQRELVEACTRYVVYSTRASGRYVIACGDSVGCV